MTVRTEKGEVMARRVRPEVVRRRLVALLDPQRVVPERTERSAEWRAGYAAGVGAARDVVRRG
jgi:hypothetical protein